jgi:tRNA-dihydrouridine synthase
MSKHMEFMVISKGENRACIEIRKHFTHYLHGFEGVRDYRKRLAQVSSLTETESILKELSEIDVVSLEGQE